MRLLDQPRALLRCPADRLDDAVEIGEFLSEALADEVDAILSVLDLVAAHSQERDQKLLRLRLRDPTQILIDQTFDRGAGPVQPFVQALGLGKAELFLLVNQVAEAAFERLHLHAQDADIGALIRIGGRFDDLEAMQRGVVVGAEQIDKIVTGLRREFLGAHPHGRERDLEFAAGVGEYGRLLCALEGGVDLGLAGRESDTVGEKSNHRDDRQRDNAGANGDPGNKQPR